MPIPPCSPPDCQASQPLETGPRGARNTRRRNITDERRIGDRCASPAARRCGDRPLSQRHRPGSSPQSWKGFRASKSNIRSSLPRSHRSCFSEVLRARRSRGRVRRFAPPPARSSRASCADIEVEPGSLDRVGEGVQRGSIVSSAQDRAPALRAMADYAKALAAGKAGTNGERYANGSHSLLRTSARHGAWLHQEAP